MSNVSGLSLVVGETDLQLTTDCDELLAQLQPLANCINIILGNKRHVIPDEVKALLKDADKSKGRIFDQWPSRECDAVQSQLDTFNKDKKAFGKARVAYSNDPEQRAALEELLDKHARVLECLEMLCITVSEVIRLVELGQKQLTSKHGDIVSNSGRAGTIKFAPAPWDGITAEIKQFVQYVEVRARIVHVLASVSRSLLLNEFEELKEIGMPVTPAVLGRLRDMAYDVAPDIYAGSAISNSQRSELKLDADNYYRVSDTTNTNAIWCVVSHATTSKPAIKCGRILKAESAKHAAYLLGHAESDGPTIVNKANNMILWHAGIEQAWTDGRIAIVPTIGNDISTKPLHLDKQDRFKNRKIVDLVTRQDLTKPPSEFRIALIDRSLENEVFDLGPLTWGDLEKRALDFGTVNANRPNINHLYIASIFHFWMAKQRGYDRWYEFEELCIREKLWAKQSDTIRLTMLPHLAHCLGLPRLGEWSGKPIEQKTIFKKALAKLKGTSTPAPEYALSPGTERTKVSELMRILEARHGRNQPHILFNWDESDNEDDPYSVYEIDCFIRQSHEAALKGQSR